MTERGSLSYDASASNTSSGYPRTAIVTGASQGIGAGLVTRFLEKGYNVVGTSRAISASTNLTPSPRLALVGGDIGDCATAQKITDTAIARFGRIDVLVNNAGLLLAKPFIDYTSGDFAALVSTILAGFFYISQSAARQMLRQQPRGCEGAQAAFWRSGSRGATHLTRMSTRPDATSGSQGR